MNAGALQAGTEGAMMPPELRSRPDVAGNVAGFGESLAAALQPDDADDRAAEAEAQKLREAAEQLVATALIRPIFQQMRDSPFQTEMFDGGLAEDIFTSQLDTHLADEVVGASNMPLVEAVEAYIQRRGAGAIPAEAQKSQELNLHG